MQSWIPYASRCILSLFLGYEKAAERASQIQDTNRKHLSRLATALTDFQKAQCFYMLATNVAALVVVKRGQLGPVTLQQIFNTYVFIKVVAICGYLPVTFVLFTLHIIGMLSWYLLLLSSFSVISSMGTLGIIGAFDPSPANIRDLTDEYSSGGPESCGGKKPGAFCLSMGRLNSTETLTIYSEAYEASEAAYGILIFCLIVLVLLFTQQGKVMTRPVVRRCMNRMHNHLKRLPYLYRPVSQMLSRVLDYEMI